MNRINGMLGEYVLCEDGFEVIETEKAMTEAEMEDELLDRMIEALEKQIEENKEKERG